MEVAEVDRHIGCQGQARMISKFLAPVPGQRPAQLARQVLHLLGQGCYDRRAVLVAHFGGHHVARVALDERGDVAVLLASDQITFPVAGDGAVLRGRRSLAD